MGYDGRISKLKNELKKSNEGFLSDFDWAVNQGVEKTLNYIVSGDKDIGFDVERVEVKTDYSTMGDALQNLLDEYREDDDNYIEDVLHIFDLSLEKLNNYDLIEFYDGINTNKYFKTLNDYKKALIYTIQCIGFFIDTVKSIENETDDIFDTSNLHTTILDITDAYLEVLTLNEKIPLKRYG